MSAFGRSGRVAVGLCCLLAVTACYIDCDRVQAQTTPSSQEIRQRMEQTRRDIEQRRREMERNRSSSFPRSSTSFRPRSSSSFKSSPSSSTVRSKFPEYKWSAGQQFGFSVTIQWSDNQYSHRVTGTPFYHVRSIDGSKATILVIGRFRHAVKKPDEDDYRILKSYDYWIPTIQKIGRRSIEDFGNRAAGDMRLPYLMSEFVNLPLMLTPSLPTTFDRRIGKTQPAVLSRTANGVTLWEGFTKSNGAAGEVSRYRESKSMGGTVQIVEDEAFEQGDLAITYKATTLVEMSTGLVRSVSGRYAAKSDEQTTVATISVRRLSGNQLAAAKKTAFDDLDRLPPSLVPNR